MLASSEVFSFWIRASFWPRLASFLFCMLAADFSFRGGCLRDIALPPRFKENAFGSEAIRDQSEECSQLNPKMFCVI